MNVELIPNSPKNEGYFYLNLYNGSTLEQLIDYIEQHQDKYSDGYIYMDEDRNTSTKTVTYYHLGKVNKIDRWEEIKNDKVDCAVVQFTHIVPRYLCAKDNPNYEEYQKKNEENKKKANFYIHI